MAFSSIVDHLDLQENSSIPAKMEIYRCLTYKNIFYADCSTAMMKEQLLRRKFETSAMHLYSLRFERISIFQEDEVFSASDYKAKFTIMHTVYTQKTTRKGGMNKSVL